MKELEAAVEISTQYYRIQKALLCIYFLISLSLLFSHMCI